MSHSRNTPEHPLTDLARFAFRWSAHLCDPDHACGSYHRMWSAVRLLEQDGALPAGAPFFASQIAAAARVGKVSILLSGTADTGLLELACLGAAQAGLDASYTVIDRCKTPLAQCRLFGEINQLALTCHQMTPDNLPEGEHDVILAHSFLAFIPPDHRAAVIAGWARALRAGGRVVMSQRLVAEGDSYQRQRPPEQIATRRDRLQARLEQDNPFAENIPTLLDAAEALWTNTLGGNGLLLSELEALSDAAGFDVLAATPDMGGESTSPFALKSQATKRPRVEIVLQKSG